MVIGNQYGIARSHAFLEGVAARLGNNVYEELSRRVSYGEALAGEVIAERMLRIELLYLGALREYQEPAWQVEAQAFDGWVPLAELRGDVPIDQMIERFAQLRALMERAHPPLPHQMGHEFAIHWPMAQHVHIRGILRDE